MRKRAAASRKSRISRSLRIAAISRMASAPCAAASSTCSGRNGKVLAQNRQRHRRAGGFQIGQAALEESLVGENGNGRRAAALVSRGDARRVEIRRQHAAAGRRLLDFRDNGGRAGGERRAKIAARDRSRFRLAFPLVHHGNPAAKLLALLSDNSSQNVRNSVDQGCFFMVSTPLPDGRGSGAGVDLSPGAATVRERGLGAATLTRSPNAV